jgi:hypothetical protein
MSGSITDVPGIEEQNIGVDVGVTVVPIVAEAVLNDLGFHGRQGAP